MKSTAKSNGAHGEPAPNCAGKRFAIVAARFYRDLTDQLVDGAKRALAECGVAGDDIISYDVPGCFELPLACQKLIDSESVDAVVALGVVIRGETPHFDFVAGECARGIMDVQLATSVPIGFGVLTTENLAQAQERADPGRGDKGYEAAMAAAALLLIPRSVPRAGFRS
ncbi:MAG TPA: 6,7-dimethyl-8-ribityllumazine synthase [Candidatus Baltobacteraceae bacterium]|nr:6,7-dimethyl-8-ribityllumazine synthase [Candidatus Baltobacteraceae bacterium]